MAKKRPKLVIHLLLPALFFGACHFFEHAGNIDNELKTCPLNDGYPCPCDATRKEGVYCDDGSVCLYGTDPTRGFCSAQCNDIGGTAECDFITELYGVTGLCTALGDTTSEGQCIVACEFQDVEGDCPPGLACEQEATDGFRACLPITEKAPDPDEMAARDTCSAFCNQFTRCTANPTMTLEECITNCIVDDWRSDDCVQCWLLCTGRDSCDTFNNCIGVCPCS